MRICHVSPHLPPDQAANALLPAELGAWCAARGDTVDYVAHEPVQGGVSAADPPRVHRLPHRRRPSGLEQWLKLDAMRVMRDVRQTLQRVAANAEVIHLHSNGLIIEVAADFAARRRIPFVLTLYGTEVWHYRRRWPFDGFRRAYLSANQVTFYSRFLMEKAKELGLDRPNLSVVYPIVANRFTPADATTRTAWREALGVREPLVILNVKRLHELAAQSDLIEAFVPIAESRADVRLVICGTGHLRADLESRARTLGVADRVTFTGLVSNDTVARYCAVADVFALPSLLEAMPTVAVEALASGTPVVSTDHPGGIELHELFGDDVAVVPKQKPAALTKALTAALDAHCRTTPTTAVTLDRLFRPAAVLAAYDAIYAAARAVKVR